MIEEPERISRDVCNCKRAVSFFCYFARGGRGGSFPTTGARTSDSEIRFARPILFGDGFLQGSPVPDSEGETKPVAHHHDTASESTRCSCCGLLSELGRPVLRSRMRRNRGRCRARSKSPLARSQPKTRGKGQPCSLHLFD